MRKTTILSKHSWGFLAVVLIVACGDNAISDSMIVDQLSVEQKIELCSSFDTDKKVTCANGDMIDLIGLHACYSTLIQTEIAVREGSCSINVKQFRDCMTAISTDPCKSSESAKCRLLADCDK